MTETTFEALAEDGTRHTILVTQSHIISKEIGTSLSIPVRFRAKTEEGHEVLESFGKYWVLKDDVPIPVTPCARRLKPCPFCGCEDVKCRTSKEPKSPTKPFGDEIPYVTCPGCRALCEYAGRKPEEAILEWNMRAVPKGTTHEDDRRSRVRPANEARRKLRLRIISALVASQTSGGVNKALGLVAE